MKIRWAIILLCATFVLRAGPGLASDQVRLPAGERDLAKQDYQKMRQLLVDDTFLKQADRLARRQAVTGVRADYDTEPRLSDDAAAGVTPASTRIDVLRLIRHCEEIGATCYHFLIGHQKTDWDDFPLFVEAAEKSPDLRSRGFTIWVYLVPPSESRRGKSEPFGLDFVAWMENVARFSVDHPSVTAICIDDFYWSPENQALFTRDYLKRMRAAADRYNPHLALVTVMYWEEIEPAREVAAMKEVSVIADAIDGILYPYMAVSLGKRYSHKETSALPAELKRLRQFYPGIPVIVDIYVTKHSRSSDLPDPDWVGKLIDLSSENADGVALYGSPKKNRQGGFSGAWSGSMRDPAGIFEAISTRYRARLKP